MQASLDDFLVGHSAELEFENKTEFESWRMNALTALSEYEDLCPAHTGVYGQVADLEFDMEGVRHCIAMLKAFKDDLESGSLSSLSVTIEVEVSSGLLEQAVALLPENPEHPEIQAGIAAAVSGVVLERFVKGCCDRCSPPIPVEVNGRPQQMDDIISALVKANQISKTEAADLRAWTAKRNKGAHGDFAGLTPKEINVMIEGIRVFMSKHA